MISVKLIDMDFLLPVKGDTGGADLSNHLGWPIKILRVAAKEERKKSRRLSFGDSRRPYQAYGNGRTVRHRTAGRSLANLIRAMVSSTS